MRLVIAVILFFCCGSAVVSSCWTRTRPLLADFLLRLCLAFGFGLGIFSVVFFLCRVLAVDRVFLVDLAVLMGLSVILLVRFRKMLARPAIVHGPEADLPGWFAKSLTAAFAVAVCGALYAAVLRMKTFPQGDGWDAFAIWNLHARFLFLGGAHWRDGFTALLPGSHPDYPLLLPAAVAHLWSYLGWDDPRVPAAIGFAFTFATVGVLFASLSILRGKTSAMLAGMVLLATPFFIEQGTVQYADVPLGFFFLATVALLCIYDNRMENSTAPGFLVLAGLAAGFAAWTKNEGLVFLLAIGASRVLMVFRSRKRASPDSQAARSREDWHSLVPIVAAILPALLLIAYFKRTIAPPSELFADRAALFHKLLEPSRYWAIVQSYVKEFLRFGHWLLIPGTLLLVGFYFSGGKSKRYVEQLGFRTSVLALTLTLAGYFAVYLITPYDLYWHLRFSLSRLFLQVWPSAVFLFFLSMGSWREQFVKTL